LYVNITLCSCAKSHFILFADIEAEVHYAVQNEYAQTAVDFIARRSRLSFLNAGAALDVLPRVITLMGDDLGWDVTRRREEWHRAREFLVSMGLPPPVAGEIDDVKGNLGGEGVVRGWAGWAKNYLRHLPIPGLYATEKPQSRHHSRALFSVEELEAVKRAFSTKDAITREEADTLIVELGLGQQDGRLLLDDLMKGVGVKNGEKIGFEQFWNVSTYVIILYTLYLRISSQVCVGLKNLASQPPSLGATISRQRIPVFKSGGGV